MSEIKSQIKAYIVENFLFGKEDQLTDDASFLDGGIIDSTGLLELVSFLENKFSIQVADEELTPDNLDSLNKATDFIHRKLNV